MPGAGADGLVVDGQAGLRRGPLFVDGRSERRAGAGDRPGGAARGCRARRAAGRAGAAAAGGESEREQRDARERANLVLDHYVSSGWITCRSCRASGLARPPPIGAARSLLTAGSRRCEHFVKAARRHRSSRIGRAITAARRLARGRLRLEAVAEARVRVDEAAIRHRRFELAAQLADVHVDRAVAGAQLAAPDGRVQLLARRRSRPIRRAIATSSSNSRTDSVSARPLASTRPSPSRISSSPAYSVVRALGKARHDGEARTRACAVEVANS